MSKNLVLGRGKIYFDPYSAPGSYITTGLRYIGNSPEFSLEVTTTQLDHYGSDQGLKVKDDSVILQLDRKGSFKTDEISDDNMQLFLIGQKSTITTTAGTLAAGSIDGVLPDRYYQIGKSLNNLSGLRNITTVVVKDDTAVTPAVFVLGTDYTVDLVLGVLYVIPGGAIDAGTNLRLTYSTTAISRDQIQTSAIAAVEGALQFVSYNPKGPQRDFYMPYVRLTPNGAFALKGDVWQEISFNLEILQLDPSTAHIYMDGRPYTP